MKLYVTILVVLGFGVLACIGGAVAEGIAQGTPTGTGATTTTAPTPPGPVADMPADEFGEARRELRTRAHTIQTNKCRSHRWMHFRHRSWQIRPDRRTENLGYWHERVAKAQDRVSKCYPAVARRQFDRLPDWLVAAFDRIHTCEGSWKDPNAPYYGGLQMDWDFMRSYGRKALRWYGGPANLWPRYVQIRVAARAYYAGRGFGPWPTCKREV